MFLSKKTTWNNSTTLMTIAILLVSGIVNARADYFFGTPTNLGPIVNSSSYDSDMCISNDGLSLYFTSNRPGGSGSYDIWVTTRETVQDPWGEPVNLGPTVNSSDWEHTPFISADGLTLYFSSNRSGGSGHVDIWFTTRTTVSDPWGTPENLGPAINSSDADAAVNISLDGLSLFFNSTRSGGHGAQDLWVSTRLTLSDPWGEPVNLGPTVNSSDWDYVPALSADGLSLFFCSYKRSGGSGNDDIWLTTRETKDDPWGEPTNLGLAVNTQSGEAAPSISADGSTLYFGSNRADGSGQVDIWQVSIEPVIDLNGDGIVNSADMCVIVNHWGEDYPSCDIGPMPWGDGTVDVQDLIVLAENLFEDVDDPTLLAHWALDEIEGATAHDSVSGNDDYIMGGALWQPTGGVVGGALELDGVDDCLITVFGPNPADGPFSIFAYIKGGAPGQVIISQPAGADWLMADASDGKLMTELKDSEGLAGSLLSDTVINDGQWHRIGVVWNGSRRILYVDDMVVAEDVQDYFGGSGTGLYIGSGKGMEPGSFFSGLVDDVRIYNRAVSP